MRKFSLRFAGAPALLLLALRAGPAATAEPPENRARLGTVTVGAYQAEVDFQFEDDGRHYRVDVAVPKPAREPAVNADRIEVWLLARGGKAVAVKERPRPGPLVEAGNDRGVTADAIFLFQRRAERKDLVAVVVSVDGELTTLKVPPPAAREAPKP
jgi:hypothetical protein